MAFIDAASSHWTLSSSKVSVRQNAELMIHNGECDMLVSCSSVKMSTRRLWRSSFRTDGQSNNDIRPHRCRTRTVQSYSPCGTNVHLHLIRGFLGPPDSTFQTASRSVQPFLQGSRSWQTDRQTDHATPSVTIGRYVALWCGSKRWTVGGFVTEHPVTMYVTWLLFDQPAQDTRYWR